VVRIVQPKTLRANTAAKIRAGQPKMARGSGQLDDCQWISRKRRQYGAGITLVDRSKWNGVVGDG